LCTKNCCNYYSQATISREPESQVGWQLGRQRIDKCPETQPQLGSKAVGRAVSREGRLSSVGPAFQIRERPKQSPASNPLERVRARTSVRDKSGLRSQNSTQIIRHLVIIWKKPQPDVGIATQTEKVYTNVLFVLFKPFSFVCFLYFVYLFPVNHLRKLFSSAWPIWIADLANKQLLWFPVTFFFLFKCF